MARAINFPFTFRGNGTLVDTEDTAKIYIDRVLTLLSTNVGQRPMLPEYGTDLSHALFESDRFLEKEVVDAVNASVSRWIPDVIVEDVKVGLPGDNGIADVEITLRLPNDTLTAVQTNTAIFYADGTITKQ